MADPVSDFPDHEAREHGFALPGVPENATMTRTELLTARGYSPEVINGHGPVAEASPAPAERMCRGCGAALEGPPSKVWCSDQCRHRHQRKAQVAPTSLSSASPPSAPQAAAQGEASEVPAGDNPEPVVRSAVTLVREEHLLAVLESLSGQLAPGWRAVLEDGKVALYWGPIANLSHPRDK